jgi:ATP-binding cassette, subfamily B, heavy metal transporter
MENEDFEGSFLPVCILNCIYRKKFKELKEEEKKPKASIFQRLKTHYSLFKKFLPYLWPKGRLDLKFRVLLSIFLLIISKVINVATPWVCFIFLSKAYKYAIDILGGDGDIQIPWLFICLYGGGRILSDATSNLIDTSFIAVSQNALKDAAIETFEHLHGLSLEYHLKRKTGTVLRGIDRYFFLL